MGSCGRVGQNQRLRYLVWTKAARLFARCCRSGGDVVGCPGQNCRRYIRLLATSLLNFRWDLEQCIWQSNLLGQFKCIVKFAGRRSGFITQFHPIDVDHLVKLCVLSNSNHKLLLVQVVHLRSTNRDNIDRSDMLIAMGNPDRNVSKGFDVGSFESSTAVGVVMALEHQIDVVLIKDRFPK